MSAVCWTIACSLISSLKKEINHAREPHLGCQALGLNCKDKPSSPDTQRPEARTQRPKKPKRVTVEPSPLSWSVRFGRTPIPQQPGLFVSPMKRHAPVASKMIADRATALARGAPHHHCLRAGQKTTPDRSDCAFGRRAGCSSSAPHGRSLRRCLRWARPPRMPPRQRLK